VVILTNWMSNWIESLIRNEWLIWMSDRWEIDHLQMWKFSLVYEMNADLNNVFDSLDLIVKYASQFIRPNWIQKYHNPVEKLMLIMNRLAHQLIFEFRNEIEIAFEFEGWDLLGSEADWAVCGVGDSWKVYCHLSYLCDVHCPVCAMMLSRRTTNFCDQIFSSPEKIRAAECGHYDQWIMPHRIIYSSGNYHPCNLSVFRNNINRCFSVAIVRLRWSETLLWQRSWIQSRKYS
jgi:hypothetical protein